MFSSPYINALCASGYIFLVASVMSVVSANLKDKPDTFFDKAGGVSKDTNRLDGDNDGEACESLPKGN